MRGKMYPCPTAGCPGKEKQPDVFCPKCWFRMVDRTRQLVHRMNVECRGLSVQDQTDMFGMVESIIDSGPLFRRTITDMIGSLPDMKEV